MLEANARLGLPQRDITIQLEQLLGWRFGTCTQLVLTREQMAAIGTEDLHVLADVVKKVERLARTLAVEGPQPTKRAPTTSATEESKSSSDGVQATTQLNDDTNSSSPSTQPQRPPMRNFLPLRIVQSSKSQADLVRSFIDGDLPLKDVPLARTSAFNLAELHLRSRWTLAMAESLIPADQFKQYRLDSQPARQ
jgi:hypothetical protein